MTDIKTLKSLTELETCGVKFLKKQELTLCLEKKYVKSVDFGVTKVLASKYLEFEPSLNGVLLNKEDCKNVRVISEINDDVEYFHASLQVNCYVFCPVVGNHLNVKIEKVNEKYATALALESFKVHIPKLPANIHLQPGQNVAIRIVSLAYSKGVPDLIGELVQRTSEGKSPKRKTDESSEKKKRVKKTGKFNDNSKEQTHTAHTTPKKEIKKPDANTPREKFDLPEDFTVILKNTDKKSWKEYQGPDGKRYRSLLEIQRTLAVTRNSPHTTSKAEEASNLDEKSIGLESLNVERDWRILEDGSIKRNKNKLYKSESLTRFPKKPSYYFDEEKTKSKNP